MKKFVPLLIGLAVGSLLHSSPVGATEFQPEPGLRCWNSESALQENLPLGEASRQTEIVNIVGIIDRDQGMVGGWLYETREGRKFLQSRDAFQGRLATVLISLGDEQLGEFLRQTRSKSYIPVPKTMDIERQLRAEQLIADCVTHPLP